MYRITIIQARTSNNILRQEQECFSERLRIPIEQIEPFNVLQSLPPISHLDEIDVLMIGGSGEYSAADDYDWMPELFDLVRACVQKKFPLFGSCWGHQIIARALGGSVIHDQSRAELGCGRIYLTDEGLRDSLMSQFPESFDANMGHHDRVDVLPADAIELARSDTQGNQMYRIGELPIYSTQFHSELDSLRETERLYEYREEYAKSYESEAAFQAVLDSLKETTEVDGLMKAFVDQFVVK